MFRYDFSEHQNRHIRISDMPAGYFEAIQKMAQEDPFYPMWHIAPVCGLLNDPCGLFEKDGVHHIFHQWFPAGPVHGLKHWYALTTRDFVHYEDAGVGMYPDQPCDSFGCYTGMALNDGDKTKIYYSGIMNEQMEPCVVCGEFKDGEIMERHPVVWRDPDKSGIDFRDPCVFRRDDGLYMVIGAKDTQGKGVLLLYKEDTEGFAFKGELALGEYPFGYMLECPNYFDTEDGGALFFSPMGIESQSKYDFKNVFSVVYAKGGRLDTENCRFGFEHFYEMDKGFDFYAPQTYRDETGRQILFGWLGNSKSEYPTDKNNWAHMLTMPREILWDGDRMVQRPLKELEKLRYDEREINREKQDASEETPEGKFFDVKECSFEIEAFTDGDFWIELSNEAGENVYFKGDSEEYTLDRSGMSHLYAERFGTVRYARRLEKRQTVRIFADRSSLEIFADGGKTVFTSRFFLEGKIMVRVKGMSGKLYSLKGIEIEGRGRYRGALEHR